MSKKRPAPNGPPVQEIRLSDVTITWKHRGDFEPGDQDITITGAQLGRVLRWMSHAHHFALQKQDRADVLDARLNLSGIADIMLALTDVDFEQFPDEGRGDLPCPLPRHRGRDGHARSRRGWGRGARHPRDRPARLGRAQGGGVMAARKARAPRPPAKVIDMLTWLRQDLRRRQAYTTRSGEPTPDQPASAGLLEGIARDVMARRAVAPAGNSVVDLRDVVRRQAGDAWPVA